MYKNKDRNNKLREDILKRFNSLLMTDDERAEFIGLPEGCRIREGAKIINQENLKCGKYVWIGENAILDASGGLEIGDHTSIGLSVFIWTHTSHLANLAMNNITNSPLIRRRKTKIGNGCFISGPSVIYSGVTIADHVIILPMSIVRSNIPEYSIVAGSPAKIIKTMSKEEINSEVQRIMLKNDL